MTYHGTVKGGVVVLETDSPLQDGTRVRIEVEQVQAEESLADFLKRFAGRGKGLPADLAAEHDHYIHGTPKRSAQ